MSTATRRIVFAAVAVAAVLGVSACGSSGGEATPSSSTVSRQSTPSAGSDSSTGAKTSRNGDVMFAQMMIPHHQQAVEMADMALNRDDASPDVARLARQIRAAQEPEIKRMEEWLRAWDAPVHIGEQKGHSIGMMSHADMNELEHARGGAFNRVWMTMMIDHHRSAVQMARQVLITTKNTDVESLAHAVIRGQQQEITRMQELLE